MLKVEQILVLARKTSEMLFWKLMLTSLSQNVVLIRDPEDPKSFFPRFNIEDTSNFSGLDQHKCVVSWYFLVHNYDWNNRYISRPSTELFAAKTCWKDYTTTTISRGRRICGAKMRWRHCLSWWTRPICWLVEKISGWFLPAFTPYEFTTFFFEETLTFLYVLMIFDAGHARTGTNWTAHSAHAQRVWSWIRHPFTIQLHDGKNPVLHSCFVCKSLKRLRRNGEIRAIRGHSNEGSEMKWFSVTDF